MNDFVRHYYVGNDAPPWAVALVRGIAAAVIAGATAFFAVWAQTDDVKLLITAGTVPALAVLAARFGLEGAIDQRKNGGNG